MFETRVTLTSPMPGGYRHEVERRLFFITPDITGFRLVERDGAIEEVVFTSQRRLDDEQLAAKLQYLIENDVTRQGLTRQKVVWNSGGEPSFHEAVFDRLTATGAAFQLGEGQVALGEPLIGLMDYLDGRIRAAVIERMDGQEYRYPTLIPTEALERCGYLDSFPQFVMFVTRLHSDTDVYRAFLDRYRQTGRLTTAVLADCDNVDYCLPPTMCFHTYHQLRDTRLGAGESRVVTSRGKSFRFESRYAVSLERLWDFTIREIVFLGSRGFVLDARRAFMELTFDLMTDLGLVGHCEVANDPFFCSDDTAGRILSQRLLELKYELRLGIAPGRTLAAASFNFHDQFFSRNFGIKDDTGDGVSSACVGFGLERLVYAFVCQHGPDPAGWPPTVRRAVAPAARAGA